VASGNSSGNWAAETSYLFMQHADGYQTAGPRHPLDLAGDSGPPIG